MGIVDIEMKSVGCVCFFGALIVVNSFVLDPDNVIVDTEDHDWMMTDEMATTTPIATTVVNNNVDFITAIDVGNNNETVTPVTIQNSLPTVINSYASTNITTTPRSIIQGAVLPWNIHENETFGTKAASMWGVGRIGLGQKLAILDSGISAYCGFQMTGVGYDFVTDLEISNDGDGRDPDATETIDASGVCSISSSFHGTKVASIVIGTDIGIAPAAIVSMMRVLGTCGKGYVSDVTDAIEWSSGGFIAGLGINPTPVDVISMSFVGTGACPEYLQNAINHAVERGVRLVVAAGNDGKNASHYFPPNCNHVTVVGASNRAGQYAPFSNSGSNVLLAAPGVGVAVQDMWGTLQTGSGTSFAVPHVSAFMLLGAGIYVRPYSLACVGCGRGILTSVADSRASLLSELDVPLFAAACSSSPPQNGYILDGNNPNFNIGCNAGFQPSGCVCNPCNANSFKSSAGIDLCQLASVPGRVTLATTSPHELNCVKGTFFVKNTAIADSFCQPCTPNPDFSWWKDYGQNADFTQASTYCGWTCSAGYFDQTKLTY